MSVKAVVFDVGETLVDESRYWSDWASYFGVSAENFMDRLRDVIACGQHHHAVFRSYDPDFKLAEALRAREEAGTAYSLRPSDLYADSISSLEQLRQSGYKIGIAGNQPESVQIALKSLGVPADYVASSAAFQVEKPDKLFFEKVLEMMAYAPAEVAYVGDRLDNDIFPAQNAGMKGIFLKRGPWGQDHAKRSECQNADLVVNDLAEIQPRLKSI
ncbi:HAD family hydrolase [Sneathiella marina]|uniref:HAD family hydrolase n=1 Tax=Sneathiella marina TaxID=2950108 RepID=A0ABY4W363_9PROT|nr:HAD family hydrolase [Sneathiella marina]USG61626.1 HAD family hydrolase [Sneathiella marina]